MLPPHLAKLTGGSVKARTTLTRVFLDTFSPVETRSRAYPHLKCRDAEMMTMMTS